MKWSQISTSKYLKPATLGRPAPLTITAYSEETLSDENKAVLWFEEIDKGLVLNATNGARIAETLGDDMDKWPGAVITLYATTINIRGQSVQTIRVESVSVSAAEHAREAAAATAEIIDDDVPY
jgi:hypothetical protein